MTDGFDKLLEEARAELGADAADRVDWDAVDAKLFARLDADRRAERARFTPNRRRGLTLVAVGLAAAVAIVALLAGKTREPPAADETATVESAGNVVAIEGGGPVLVDGKVVAGGAPLRLGDVLETGGARATVERAGKVTLTLEPGSKTVVTHVQGALILALERGAVEAQVVPVTAGEAFAVDVDVAGRRARDAPPRGARGPAGRGRSERGRRLGRQGAARGLAAGYPRECARSRRVHGERSGGYARADTRSFLREGSGAGVAGGDLARRGLAAPVGRQRVARSGPAVRRSALGGPVDGRNEREDRGGLARTEPRRGALEARYAQCMAERPRADNVTVVVNTTLYLDVGDDGTVRFARFDPPVAPDVNACSAAAIYRERFGRSGSVAIPIDFTN